MSHRPLQQACVLIATRRPPRERGTQRPRSQPAIACLRCGAFRTHSAPLGKETVLSKPFSCTSLRRCHRRAQRNCAAAAGLSRRFAKKKTAPALSALTCATKVCRSTLSVGWHIACVVDGARSERNETFTHHHPPADPQ